ncbi:MAG TPA: hypothetical protein EYP62_08270 [Kiritimatiellae bacterium]|nr:hypothetical protein [Kiritimatiellia bacterium]
MRTYRYRGITSSGSLARGLIEADNAKDARTRLLGGGIIAEELAPLGSGAGDRRMRIPRRARAELYRGLADLINAGMPASQALASLRETLGDRRTQMLAALALDRIREGASLADALAQADITYDEAERILISAGEKSGRVADLLLRTAEHLEREADLYERVRALCFYPFLVAVLALGVAGLMFFVVMPRFLMMLQKAGVALPAGAETGLLLARGVLAAIAAGLVLLLALVFVGGRRDAHGRVLVERVLRRMPLIGPVLAARHTARMARTFSLLLKGGVDTVQALRMSVEASGSPLAASMSGEAAAAVEHGAAVSEAVNSLAGIDPTISRWCRIGESSGDLAGALERGAEVFLRKWLQSAEHLVATLEPLLVLGVGALVLLVAVNLLLPVLRLSRSLAF